MNSLNSILIEGKIIRSGHCKKVAGMDCTFFSIENKTTLLGNDISSVFSVEVFGKLATVCAEKCTRHSFVRVVGKLVQSETKDVKIIAEHVEFKYISPREDTEGFDF